MINRPRLYQSSIHICVIISRPIDKITEIHLKEESDAQLIILYFVQMTL